MKLGILLQYSSTNVDYFSSLTCKQKVVMVQNGGSHFLKKSDSFGLLRHDDM
jgi:hypothetical protein